MLDMNYVQDFEVVFCYRKSLTQIIVETKEKPLYIFRGQ